jgi:uncharacterized membrane protein
MQVKKLALLNLIAFGIHFTLSWLTRLELINARGIADVSNKYRTLFTPAGFTFLIWPVIYAALIAFCVYHLVKATRNDENHPANIDLKKIGLLFIVNNLVTALWLFAWTNEWITVSVVLIFIQLITLMMMNIRLGIHDSKASFWSKLFTQFPLSIYFAWICIATIANTSAWLKSINWSGWGVSEINWAITMIAITILITVWVINRRCNVSFGAVVVWAFYGILSRLSHDPLTFKPVVWIAWAGMAIVLAAMMFGLIRNIYSSITHHQKVKGER